MAEGRLIALEGLDGSGKTTQARLLAERLQAAGIPALLTAEPSHGPIGRLLRDLIAAPLTDAPPVIRPNAPGEPTRPLPSAPPPDDPPPDAALLALLFAADRRDHLRREIEPAVRRGEWVVTDRYLLSSLAYQFAAEETDLAWIAAINRTARPADVTLYLRLSVADCLARLAARGARADVFEAPDRLQRIARRYEAGRAFLHAQGWSVIDIDAGGSVDEVAERIFRAVAPS